jgi:glucosylceramidase
VGRHLGPLLKARGLKTQILEWDHNWDEPWSPMAMLADQTARQYVSGVAWHCYAGDVSAQSQVAQHFPELDVWFTECSGGEWKPQWAETLPWMMRNLVIGSTRHGARGVLMWTWPWTRPTARTWAAATTAVAWSPSIPGRQGHAQHRVLRLRPRQPLREARRPPGGLRAAPGAGPRGLHQPRRQHRAHREQLGQGRPALPCKRQGSATYELPASGVVTFTW